MVTAQNRTSDVGLPKCVREVIEVDVVVLRVHGVPGELRVADGHLVAVVRNDGELVGKILLLDGRLDGAVGESVDADRLQEQPALDEAVGAGRLLRRGGPRQCRRRDWIRGDGNGGEPPAECAQSRQRIVVYGSSCHGVLNSQCCFSLLGSNFASVAKLLPDGRKSERFLGVRDRLGHDAPRAVGKLVHPPQLFGPLR